MCVLTWLHTTHHIQDRLECHDIDVKVHPPNSPDLTPCDFCLFLTLKHRFWGQSFQSDTYVVQKVQQIYGRIKGICQNSHKKMGPAYNAVCRDRWVVF